MNGVPRLSPAAAALLLLAAAPARTAGFFDDVPRRGYVRGDVAMDVLDVSAAGAVVARVRYLRLALDPGRRDIVYERWPEREILLVESAAGERVAFDRLSKLPEGRDASALVPRGRIGLAGTSLETFARPSPAAGADPCAALDAVVRAGSLELPVSTSDLGLRTVRTGVARAVETALGPRERELIAQTVPILVAAESQGLPAAPLEVLKVLFPGQPFARSARSLTFRPSSAEPPNPADGAWRSVTEAPELLPGVPLY